MNISNSVISALKEVHKIMKPHGFICLPKSVFTFLHLQKTCPDESFQIKLGNLHFTCIDGTEICLFRQNFDVNAIVDNEFENLNSQNLSENESIEHNWRGHAWVEMNDRYIIDMSFFPTLYCDAMPEYLKGVIIHAFGNDRAILVIDKLTNQTPLRYEELGIMSEKVIDTQAEWLLDDSDFFLRQQVE